MNENDMLNELLTYAAYDTEKVIEYWNMLDSEQKFAAYTLYTSGDADAICCVEVAYSNEYRLFSPECQSLADVACEDLSDLDGNTLLSVLDSMPGGWTNYIDWDAIGRYKDTVHDLNYSGTTRRWIECFQLINPITIT